MPADMELREACQRLCGNMRYVSRYLRVASQHLSALDKGSSSQRQAVHASSLDGVERSFVETLAGRLRSRLQDPRELSGRSAAEQPLHLSVLSKVVSRELFSAMALDASLLVRSDSSMARDRSPRTRDIIGHIGRMVLRELLASTTPDQLRQYQLRRVEGVASLAMKSAGELETGEMLESEVQKRLQLGMLAPRAWRLETLCSVPDLRTGLQGADSAAGSTGKLTAAKQQRRRLAQLRDAHRSCKFRAGLTADAHPDARDFLGLSLQQNPYVWMPSGYAPAQSRVMQQSASGQSSIVDEAVSAAAAACVSGGGSLLIRTADNFQGVDFVLLRRGKHGRMAVTFFEATISTLAQHGQGKPGKNVSRSLRDLHAITVLEFPTATHTDGSWKLHRSGKDESCSSGWVQGAPETVVNFWLKVLGCPARVVGEVRDQGTRAVDEDEDGGVSSQGLKVSVQQAGVWGAVGGDNEADAAGAGGADAAEWDVSIVYVSSARVGAVHRAYAKLEADCVYGVFREDLDDAVEAWGLLEVDDGEGDSAWQV